MFLLHINVSTTIPTSDKHESLTPQFKIILSMHILFLFTALLYHTTGYIYGILWHSYETATQLIMKVHNIINIYECFNIVFNGMGPLHVQHKTGTQYPRSRIMLKTVHPWKLSVTSI